MAAPDKAPDMFDTVETVTFLAEEDRTDRRVLWRLGAWALGAVGAVTLAVFVSQTAIEQRRVTVADASGTIRQAQQLQSLIKQNQNEANRLALAVETLNNDRDRLYARVSTLEQGLDSVTGTVNRRASATATPAPEKAAPAPTLAKPDTVSVADPTSPLMPARSLMSPPDPAASKFSEPAPIEPTKIQPDVVASLPEAAPAEAPASPANIGLDLGSAPTLDGLRLAWRRVAKAHAELAALQPLIAIRERPAPLGVQFRLIAGPLNEAAAAQLCSTLSGTGTACEPVNYDGQKLTLASSAPSIVPKPPRRKPVPRPVQPATVQPAPPSPAR